MTLSYAPDMSNGELQGSGERVQSLLKSMGEEDMVVLRKMVAYEDYKKKMHKLRHSKSKGSLIVAAGAAARGRSESVGEWGIVTWSDIKLKNSVSNQQDKESEGEDQGGERAMTIPGLDLGHSPLLISDFLVSLRLEDVGFKVKERLTGPKRFFPFLNCFRKRNLGILNVNGLHLKAGAVTGLMGPSGAGKSTLLQILAGRYDGDEVKGYLNVEMGDAEDAVEAALKSEIVCLKPNQYRLWAKNNVGYVSQECHLWPQLTVRETLYFSALLYLPSSIPMAQKRRRAEEVMKFVGLEEVADVKVGSSLSKGISGGQKKRLSLGVELINAPPVLVLDEPTSGLDSSAAMKIVDLLRNVAQTGRIVIVSIHQPSQKLFEQFDQILFLNKGFMLFDGPTDKMHRYAASLGMRCPIDENPADYFMAVFKDLKATEEDFRAWEKQEEEPKGKQEEETSSNEWSKKSESENENERELEKGWEKVKKRKSFQSGKCNRGLKDHLWVFLVLLYRETIMICRDWVFLLQLPLGAVLSALIASLYAGIGGAGSSITTAFSLFVPFYFLQGYSANTALRLCDDHHILRWEVSQKLYHEVPFFLARWIVVESCYYIVMAQLVCVVWYWIVGIQHSTEDFFYFCLMCQMVTFFASSIARLYALLLPHTTFINLCYQLVAMFFANMNGWFITYNSMVDFWSWVFWINPYSYYIMAIMPRELDKTSEGQQLLEQLDFPIQGMYYIYPLVILGETCIVLVISFFAFKYLHKKIM